MITVNIIGGGKVGQTLGHLLARHKIGRILYVVNTDLAHAAAACQFIGDGIPVATVQLSQITPADLTVIATPDEKIRPIVMQLVSQKLLLPQSTVVHCSGAHSSDILACARSLGVFVASMHPLSSFASPAITAAHFAGTYCAVEGDAEALILIESVMSALGVHGVRIDHPHQKSLYHAACVLAANYPVILCEMAIQAFIGAGISHQEAQTITLSLMQTTVRNMTMLNHPLRALTGPLQRGETQTVRTHLDALKKYPPIKALYSALTVATLSCMTPIASAAINDRVEHVILLHGLGRTPAVMATMAAHLQQRGYVVHNLGYPSTREAMHLLSENIFKQMLSVQRAWASGPTHQTWHFVGYSLGGILVRDILSRHTITDLGRVVLLGPPNQGSEVAAYLAQSQLFGALYLRIYGPAGLALAQTPMPLSEPYYPCGIIAGSRHAIRDTLFSWFLLQGPDDGKVTVASTHLPGATAHITLRVNHPQMPKNKEVIRQTISFLEQGVFAA